MGRKYFGQVETIVDGRNFSETMRVMINIGMLGVIAVKRINAVIALILHYVNGMLVWHELRNASLEAMLRNIHEVQNGQR